MSGNFNSFSDFSFSECEDINGATFMIAFNNEIDISKKVLYAQNFVRENAIHLNTNFVYVQEFSNHIVPAICNFFSTILDMCDAEQSMDQLKEIMQYAIETLSCFDIIMAKLSEKQLHSFINLHTILLEICSVVLATFQFCLESDKSYSDSLSNLQETVMLFKKNQDVLNHLLKIVEGCIKINFEDDTECSSFTQLLANLEKIGEMLSGVNVKSYVETWRSLLSIFTKNQAFIIDNYNVETPITFLCDDIQKTLQVILEPDIPDINTIINQLKLASFKLKILAKMLEMFSSSKCNSVYQKLWQFLYQVNKHHPIQNNMKTYPKHILDRLQLYFYASIERITADVSKDTSFISNYKTNKLSCKKYDEMSLLLILIPTMEGLIHADKNCVSVDILTEVLHDLFISYNAVSNKFECVKYNNDAIHTNLVANLSSLGCTLPEKLYAVFETVMLQNLLSDQQFCVLLSSDVWYFTLKHSKSMLAYNTVCKIVELSSDFLKQLVNVTPQYVALKNFISRIFRLLEVHQKRAFFEKYVFHAKNLHLYRCISLVDICPNIVKAMTGKMDDLLEQFLSGRISTEDFKFMCSLLDTLADDIVLQANIVPNLVKIVQNIWTNINENENLTGHEVLNTILLQALQKLSAVLFDKMDSKQQNFLLKKLSAISSELDVTKIGLLQIVSFNAIPPNYYSHFFKLANDSDTVIQHKITMKIPSLNKNQVDCDTFDTNQYFDQLASRTFTHKCVVWNNNFEPLFKKIKYDNIQPTKSYINSVTTTSINNKENEENINGNDYADDSVADLISEIKKIAKQLKKHTNNEEFTSKNKYHLQAAINQLSGILQ